MEVPGVVEMFEMFEELLNRATRILRLTTCMGLSGYVAWKSQFIVPETYGDLAVPGLMAMFCITLLLIATSLHARDQRQREG